MKNKYLKFHELSWRGKIKWLFGQRFERIPPAKMASIIAKLAAEMLEENCSFIKGLEIEER